MIETMIPYLVDWGYLGLFIAAFLAGSILPFGSEAILVALILPKIGLSPFWCVFWASMGNTLGGMTCYYLGSLGKIQWIERWLGVKEDKLDRMVKRLRNKSGVIAFFTFLPIVGDVIAIALGYMRSNLIVVAIAMFLGKVGRYAILAYATLTALTM
jgi:membrane protein YqaA with SNARE-associated domain